MSTHVRLTNIKTGEVIDLNEIDKSSYGAEAQPGITGFGLPPISVLTDDGAGDGSVYRGRKVGSRVIDLPIKILTQNYASLVAKTDQLARVIDGRIHFDIVTVEGESTTIWRITGSITGGGDYDYGKDTLGNKYVETIFTFQSESPYWEKQTPVSASWSSGSMTLVDDGNAPASPVFTVTGPTNGFTLSMGSESVQYVGIVEYDQQITLDFEHGTVRDNRGNNCYQYISPFPEFFKIPALGGTVTFAPDLSSDAYVTGYGTPRRNHVLNPALTNNADSWTLQGFTHGSARLNQNSDQVGPAAKTVVTGLTPGEFYNVIIRHRMIPVNYPGNAFVVPGYVGVLDSGQLKSTPLEHSDTEVEVRFGFTADSSSVEFVYQPEFAVINGTPIRSKGHLDQVFIGKTGDYFDGSTPDTDEFDYSWTGAAHNSQSIASPKSTPTSGAQVSVTYKPRKWWFI